MRFTKKIMGKGNDLLIIFPPWKSSGLIYPIISKKLSKKFCVITYYYSSDILTSDVQQTLKNFQAIIRDAKKLIRALKHDNINIIGFSIGSYLAFMLAKRLLERSGLCIITSSSRFSDFVWYSTSTKKIKKGILDQKVNLHLLESKWKAISPCNNIKDRVKIHVVLSRSDRTIPYRHGKELIKNLNKNNINFKLRLYEKVPHWLILVIYLVKLYVSDLGL
jgi:esterase/lipase